MKRPGGRLSKSDGLEVLAKTAPRPLGFVVADDAGGFTGYILLGARFKRLNRRQLLADGLQFVSLGVHGGEMRDRVGGDRRGRQ